MNTLEWLQNWYRNECNDDWEHYYGIKIESTDNPGWIVTIDVENTSIKDQEISYKLVENSKTDWVGYSIKEGKFHGAGDSLKLEAIINIFKNIVENPIDFS